MKKRILCFGDSNTWGYIAGTGERFGENIRWTGVLQSELGNEYSVLEEGLSGRTSAYDVGFDKLYNGLDSLGYVLYSQMPIDIAVIFLGTNDLVEHSLNRMERGVNEVVRQVKNANFIIRSKTPIFPNGAKIILIEPIPYSKGCDQPEEKIRESYGFHQAFVNIAKELDVELLEISSFAEASEIDGIHLTSTTHRQLGKIVAERVKKILEDR